MNRYLSADGMAAFHAAQEAGLFLTLLEQGLILPLEVMGAIDGEILSQPLLPWPSLPYEWTYGALREAALLHLKVHRLALSRGFTLSDASSFNIQFDGCRPYFVDLGSFIPFTPGQPWLGYRQFCEQFLYPLLLESQTGQAFNPVFRGNGAGVTAEQLVAWLPRFSMLRPRVLLHVYLPHWLNRRATQGGTGISSSTARHMNAEVLDEMLAGLARWIASLESPQRSNQRWGSYVAERTYDTQEVEEKKRFVSRFIQETRPSLVLDLGCNTGEMAHIALAAGAVRVIGYERDGEAANQAYRGALKEKAGFLPLVMDLLNPSPDQGWGQKEWPGLEQRAKQADGLLALALVHHLALGSGIPLAQVIAWLVSLAPRGVIEFIPPEDEMAQSLIRRVGKRHFAYDREAFVASLSAVAQIVTTATITASGRTLFAYERL